MSRPWRMAQRSATCALAAACAGCAGWQSALDPHSVQADALMRLIVGIVVTCAVIWTVVTAVLVTALRRRRTRAAGDTQVDARTERRMARTITAAALATLAVVTALTVASFAATRQIGSAGPNPLVINIRGWQWWWEVSYPGDSPGQRLVTANEIHVPLGRSVRLQLAAADVIHSFWVPNLSGKQDMIPGRDNALAFTPRQTGRYRAQCAEFCGLQHAHMALVVVVDEPAAFEAWRTHQLADALPPAGPEAEAGMKVFMGKACAACHTVRGTPAAATLGPDLTHVGSRQTIAAGLFETTRGSLAAWIADPQRLKPGNNMPRVDLSADELQAVSAYLAGLR